MRNTIFNAIVTLLKTLSSLKGTDGTVRVYEYATAQPDGYPAISVSSTKLESEIADSQRDLRRYIFLIRLIQEKMPEHFGPKKAERVARQREDEILSAFDNNNDLDVSGVIRTTPLSAEWGYTEENSRIVIDITIAVETSITITV